MRRRGVNRRLFGLLALGVIMVVTYQLGALRPVSGFVGTVSAPVQAVFSRFGNTTAGWFAVAGSAGQLETQNQQLRSEVASLRQQLSLDSELQAENDQLRQQLNVGNLPPDNLVAAEVIGYQPDNFRQFITIGRGSSDGISSGMAVVEQGALVGTIQDVGPHTAQVFLVIDPNFRVAALDQDEPDRPTGTIHGQIGGGLEMDEIDQTETINPGDTIVTSGLGGDVEKGLIIGHVQTNSKQDNGVFQTAQVTTDIQFSRLDIVYVVVRPQ
jgi:rod shape-determining protein MreC